MHYTCEHFTAESGNIYIVLLRRSCPTAATMPAESSTFNEKSTYGACPHPPNIQAGSVWFCSVTYSFCTIATGLPVARSSNSCHASPSPVNGTKCERRVLSARRIWEGTRF